MAQDLKVSVIDALVRADAKGHSFSVYKLKVEQKDAGRDQTWVVYRRYSEFYEFNQKVTKKYQTQNFSLPKKKLVGNLKAEFIEGRRVSLHRYMQRVLQHPIVSKSVELVEFLAPDAAGGDTAPGTAASPDAAPQAEEGGEEEVEAPSPATARLGIDDSGARVTIEDFTLLKVIGKGSFGKVMLAKKKDNNRVFAIKILNKKAVMQKGELDHVRSERNVLVSAMSHPFLVSMHYSFQSEDKLFFVMDYVNGGEMFFHLQRDKRFSENRARFYAAEIGMGIHHLHQSGIVYRDLKPENILIGADGHIILTDFGLCKEGIGYGETTRTFCGTPEYLAPEVLRNERHGLPVDWWCLGIVLYEMLTGLPPFYSENREEMYQRTLNEEVYYPTYVSKEAKQLLVGMLKRDPAERLGSSQEDYEEIKRQPFFRGINWDKLFGKKIKPPWLPKVKGEADTTNIDEEFLNESVGDAGQSAGASTLPDSVQQNFTGFTYNEVSAIAAMAGK